MNHQYSAHLHWNISHGKITLFLSMLVYRWFLEKERLLLPFFRLIFESISLKRKKIRLPFHFKQMHRVRILCAPNDICNFIFVSWLMFPITSTFSPSKYMLNLKIYKSTIASNANWCSFAVFFLFFKPKWDFDCINWRLQQIYLRKKSHYLW